MLAILGGTGPEGKGLALRFAMAGHEVIIGSRDAGRASEAAQEVAAKGHNLKITGADNETATVKADIVVLTTPYEGQKPTLTALADKLAGKIVVNAVVPMKFEGGGPKWIEVPEGSAAEEAAKLLPRSKVVAAFHNVSASDLLIPTKVVEGDVIVCGGDAEAKKVVFELVRGVKSLRPVDGGSLAFARYVEGITVLLVSVNRIHKTHSMVKIVGV